MGLKEWLTSLKENVKKKKEINKIQKEAYLKEMETQAARMGKRQAEIEAKHREKMFTKKLQVVEQKRTTTVSHEPVDVFGFNKTNKSNKRFNLITGEYGN